MLCLQQFMCVTLLTENRVLAQFIFNFILKGLKLLLLFHQSFLELSITIFEI